ncbi:PQQ-binding-like beta-propeller repeat protein [Nanoarchaeota archaeon]
MDRRGKVIIIFGILLMSVLIVFFRGSFLTGEIILDDFDEEGCTTCDQGDFDEGSYSNTGYIEDSVSLVSGVKRGSYTSEILDAGNIVSWDYVSWTEDLTTERELPDDGILSTWIDMNENVLLMHMNNNWDDFSGNENNGATNDAVFTTESKLGSHAGSFDGVGDYVRVLDNSNLDLTEYTISHWIKYNSLSDDNDGIYSYVRHEPGSNNVNTYFWLDVNGDWFEGGLTRFVFGFSDSLGSYTDHFYEFTPEIDRWYNFVQVKDENNMKLYIDGVEVYSGEETRIPNNLGNQFLDLGKHRIDSGYLDGSLDEFAIWNRVLTPEEIKNIHYRGDLNLISSFRSCDNPECYGGEWEGSMNAKGYRDLSTLENNRYFQYSFAFSSDEENYSPKLFDVIVEYEEILTECGNGDIEGDEECDDGDQNSNELPDSCRLNCQFPSCGDNVEDTNEQCDDGNIDNGDGCSSECQIEIIETIGNWPMFQHDPQSTGYEPDSLIDLTNFGVLWEFDTENPIRSAPIIVNGVVYFTGYQNQEPFVYALNANNGNLIWEYNLDISGIADTPLVYYENKLYVTHQNKIYVLDASQETMPDEDRLVGSYVHDDSSRDFLVPIIKDEILYVGCSDDKIYAFNTNVDEPWIPIWEYSGIEDPISVAVSDDTLYVADYDILNEQSYLYALDTSQSPSQRLRWSEEISSSCSSSLFYEGNIYVPNKYGYVKKFDEQGDTYDFGITGNYETYFGNCIISGSASKSPFNSPAVAYENIYIGGYSGEYSGENKFLSLDILDGAISWEYETEGGIYGSAVIADNLVFVGDSFGYIYAFNSEDGTLEWFNIVGDSFSTSPSISNGVVYIGGSDNKLYAFGPNANLEQPVVSLVLPENNYESTVDTLNFKAHYTDPEEYIGRCELVIDGISQGINNEVYSDSDFIIENSQPLSLGSHEWWMKCSDGVFEVESNERWIINIIEEVTEPECGNGDLETGEECDDNNLIDGDGCSAECVNEICGDSILQEGLDEECDNGEENNNWGECNENCQLTFCGDDFLQFLNGQGEIEICDDGLLNGVECIPEYSETCEYCSEICEPIELTGDYCGDEIVQEESGEECDNGNDNDDNSECKSDCSLNICGDDFIYEGVEECDDGNLENNDGCDEDCVIEICEFTHAQWSTADAIEGQIVSLTVESINCDDEEVSFEVWEEDDLTSDDPANLNPDSVIFNGNVATATWTAEWQCDGEILGRCTLREPEYYFRAISIEDPEINIESQAPIRLLTVYELSPTCGNEIVQGDEECDDGNNENNDGCDSNCVNEICGNGILQFGEECDDGNLVDGDGCSGLCTEEFGDWPMFQRNLQKTGYNDDATIELENFNLLWSLDIPGGVKSSPAVQGGFVYIGGGDSAYRVNALTGEEAGRLFLGADVDSSPTISKGVSYFGTDDNKFYAIDISTGEEVWSYETGDDIKSSPVVANDIVYFGSNDNYLYALNTNNGDFIWSENLYGDIKGPVAFANGFVYASSTDGTYVFDSEGNPEWSSSCGGTGCSCPTISGNNVYLRSNTGMIYVKNSETGEDISEYYLGDYEYIANCPAIAEDILYVGTSVGTDQRYFYALDISDENEIFELWSYATGARIESSPAVSGNEIVFFGSDDNNFRALNSEGGEEFIYNMGDGVTIKSSPAISDDGIVYVGSIHYDAFYNDYTGKLYAFGPNTPPSVELIYPGNNAVLYNGEIDFSAIYTDNIISPFGECELFIDEISHGTLSSIESGSEFNMRNDFQLSMGDHTWKMKCSDGVYEVESERSFRIAEEEIVEDWPMFGRDAQHTSNSLQDVDLDNYNLLWYYQFEGGGYVGTDAVFSSSPVISEEVVLISRSNLYCSDNGIFAFNAFSGNPLWNFEFENLQDSCVHKLTPAIGGGRVFAADTEGNLYSLDLQEGRDENYWSISYTDSCTSEENYISPIYADRKIFIGGCDNQVYAIDTVSGEVEWSTKPENPEVPLDIIISNIIGNVPTYYNGVVYASGDAIYAIDARSGDILWNSLDEDITWNEETFHSPEISSIKDDIMYVNVDFNNPPNCGPSLIAINLLTEEKEILWRNCYDRDVSCSTSCGTGYYSALQMTAPSIGDDLIFIGDYGGCCSEDYFDKRTLFAVDKTNGNIEWSKLFEDNTHYSRIRTPALVSNDKSFVSAIGYPGIAALDLSLGTNWEAGNSEAFTLLNFEEAGLLAFNDNILYAGSDKGIFYAFGYNTAPIVELISPDDEIDISIENPVLDFTATYTDNLIGPIGSCSLHIWGNNLRQEPRCYDEDFGVNGNCDTISNLYGSGTEFTFQDIDLDVEFYPDDVELGVYNWNIRCSDTVFETGSEIRTFEVVVDIETQSVCGNSVLEDDEQCDWGHEDVGEEEGGTFECVEGSPDVNQNGRVNIFDFNILEEQLGNEDCSSPSWCNCADINQDGLVNIVDYNLIGPQWGNGVACSPTCDSSCDYCSLDCNLITLFGDACPSSSSTSSGSSGGIYRTEIVKVKEDDVLIYEDDEILKDITFRENERNLLEVTIKNYGDHIRNLKLNATVPELIVQDIIPDRVSWLYRSRTQKFIVDLRSYSLLKDRFDIDLNFTSSHTKGGLTLPIIVLKEASPTITPPPKTPEKSIKDDIEKIIKKPWWIALLLLFFLKPAVFVDEGLLRKVATGSSRSRKKLYVTPSVYSKYGELKNIRTLKVADYDNKVRNVMKKYGVSRHLSEMIVLANKKFRAKIYTNEKIPNRLKDNFKSIKFKSGVEYVDKKYGNF